MSFLEVLIAARAPPSGGTTRRAGARHGPPEIVDFVRWKVRARRASPPCGGRLSDFNGDAYGTVRARTEQPVRCPLTSS
jgi:hypothetical protein